MRKICFFVLVLITFSLSIWGQANNFNFPILKIYDFAFTSIKSIDGNNYFGMVYNPNCTCSQLYKINLLDGSYQLLENEVYGTLLTQKDRFLLFEKLINNDKSKSGYSYAFSWYDIPEKRFKPDNTFVDPKIEEKGQFLQIYYYQNDQFFVQTDPFIPGEDGPSRPGKIALYDKKVKKMEAFPVPATLVNISPDKMHLLLDVFGSAELVSYHIPSQKTVTGYGYAKKDNTYGYARFISNSLILSLPEFYGSDKNNTVELYQLDKPQKPIIVTFKADKVRIGPPLFSKDFTRAFISVDFKTTIVDTTSFRDWLLKNNLIFQATTGTINDKEVNIRENPNLTAPILGKLDKGIVVDILDKSGVKMKIGSQNDWWYHIRLQGKEKDAVEIQGWVYGPYLTLDPVKPSPSPSASPNPTTKVE